MYEKERESERKREDRGYIEVRQSMTRLERRNGKRKNGKEKRTSIKTRCLLARFIISSVYSHPFVSQTKKSNYSNHFLQSNQMDLSSIWNSAGGDMNYFSDTSMFDTSSSLSLTSFEYLHPNFNKLNTSTPNYTPNGQPGVSLISRSPIDNDNDKPTWPRVPLPLSLSTFSNYHVAQENGQRIFGPPFDWIGGHSPPERAAEVFVGKIPRDCFEDELIPLFERPGRIYKMRLMIDFAGKNRGYGFVQYFTKEEAQNAINMLNGHKIRKNWQIGVMMSRNNNRLFFGNLPNNINRQEMFAEISKYTSGILVF